jgi:hypothetical protein
MGAFLIAAVDTAIKIGLQFRQWILAEGDGQSSSGPVLWNRSTIHRLGALGLGARMIDIIDRQIEYS